MSLPSPSPARALQTSPYRDTTTQLLVIRYHDLSNSKSVKTFWRFAPATVGDEVARQVLGDQAVRDESDSDLDMGAGAI